MKTILVILIIIIMFLIFSGRISGFAPLEGGAVNKLLKNSGYKKQSPMH